MKVTATCVRVATVVLAPASPWYETRRKLSLREARAILRRPRRLGADNPLEKMYPLAVDAAGRPDLYV